MLFANEMVHLFFSIIAALIVWWMNRKKMELRIALVLAVLAGFFIDFDHLFDYFLVFGADFSLNDFFSGGQFLLSDKIIIPLHGWEYVIILIIVIIIIKSPKIKMALSVVALSLFFHLSVDSTMNEGLTVKTYSLLYRIKNNFKVEKLVTKEHYPEHRKEKENYIFGPELN